ncbi:MAG: DUF2214 family protein [Candidatus Eremiobacteraeota bacterium]|nr:DUF2214 family protein [Candidatus Eremiobacteraeota bacterium]
MPSSVLNAVFATLHFLAIFALAASIVAELLLYAPHISAPYVRRIQRLDLFFLFAAIAVVATGLTRLFTSPQGPGFYAGNPIFWTKMGLFAIIGLLSIVPTRSFLRWNRSLEADGSVTVSPEEHRRIRGYIMAELVVLCFIPLCATLMARGIGLR